MDELTTTITIIIAVYGAALSTLLLILQIREKNPRIQVTVSTGFISGGGATTPTILYLEAANSGHVPVTLPPFPR